GRHMGIRGTGAVPVHVVTARTPGSPVVLGDRYLEVRRPVRTLDRPVRTPDRHLPAHIRLGLERMPPGAQRVGMERAPDAAGETGPVEEHAGTIDNPGLTLAFVVGLDEPVVESLVAE